MQLECLPTFGVRNPFFRLEKPAVEAQQVTVGFSSCNKYLKPLN